LRRVARIPAVAAIGLIHLYRLVLSPLVPAGTCKYHPSCSQYALDAVSEFGFVRGTILAGWRLARCNPWSEGGVDYARDQKLFRRRGPRLEGGPS
jgi:putative membrane protein insertion efficiency factor